MKKHNKMKVDEVAALRYTDEKAYRAIMKKELGGKGMSILLLCIAMMAFLNFSYMDANSIIRALPLGVIEALKTFIIVMFVFGSITYLLSLLYVDEEKTK